VGRESGESKVEEKAKKVGKKVVGGVLFPGVLDERANL